jgi:hypothetical protein
MEAAEGLPRRSARSSIAAETGDRVALDASSGSTGISSTAIGSNLPMPGYVEVWLGDQIMVKRCAQSHGVALALCSLSTCRLRVFAVRERGRGCGGT